MRNKNAFGFFCGLFVLASINACQDDNQISQTSQQTHRVSQSDRGTEAPVLPSVPYKYNAAVSDQIVTLGRVLFYDKTLSVNNTISCSSCHKQSSGFADNSSLSVGFTGASTSRNSMPIQNLTLSPGTIPDGYGSAVPSATSHVGALFWDGRESDLQKMVLLPIVNQVEMGYPDLSSVQVQIMSRTYYKKLLDDAFPNGSPNNDGPVMQRVSMALAAFVSAIQISDTRFDQYNDAIQFTGASENILTLVEIKGMELFQGKYNCNSCHHVEEKIMTPRFANIGLEQNYADNGLALFTKDEGDNGKFKVPSLRNVQFTAPYMHNGNFSTLEQVIEHYSGGITDHPNLHPDLRDEYGQPKKMNIPKEDVDALIAFLKTLSNKVILTEPKFSNPFK